MEIPQKLSGSRLKLMPRTIQEDQGQIISGAEEVKVHSFRKQRRGGGKEERGERGGHAVI